MLLSDRFVVRVTFIVDFLAPSLVKELGDIVHRLLPKVWFYWKKAMPPDVSINLELRKNLHHLKGFALEGALNIAKAISGFKSFPFL